MICGLYQGIRSGALYGFAAYGAAVIYDADRSLAPKVGIIYGIAIIALQVKPFSSTHQYDLKYINNRLSFLDAFTIIAARSIGLIGNKGILVLAAFSVARYAIIALQPSKPKQP